MEFTEFFVYLKDLFPVFSVVKSCDLIILFLIYPIECPMR